MMHLIGSALLLGEGATLLAHTAILCVIGAGPAVFALKVEDLLAQLINTGNSLFGSHHFVSFLSLLSDCIIAQSPCLVNSFFTFFLSFFSLVL
jgi:hypothetical protein